MSAQNRGSFAVYAAQDDKRLHLTRTAAYYALFRETMSTDFLSDVDKQRLWLWDRLLPFLLVIVVPVGLGLYLWADASEAKKREELVDRLNHLPATYSVVIDSTEIADRATVVNALKGIADIPGHHSGPIEPHPIRIRSEHDVIEVCLERDSERQNEYWVSTPREGRCGETSFGDPYFGRLTNDRLASFLAPRPGGQ